MSIRLFRAIMALLLFAVLTAAPGSAFAVRIVHVRPAGSGSGASWGDAYGDLQAALSAAQAGDEIWVAEGTWLPGSPGDAAAAFSLKNGVALYGGFAGTESLREERDASAHLTILSGDLGADDLYDPWPSGWSVATTNAKHVVTAQGVDGSAVLDGFTILAGYVSSETGGGGIMIQGASPLIEGCRFVHNLAGFAHGGAILVANGSPTIRSCEFTQNYAHLGDGAGIEISGASAPLIEGCRFSGNIAVGSDPTGDGAAISNHSSLPVVIRSCVFEDNVARNFYSAGDVDLAWGGAIFNMADGMIVDSCIFRRNRAHAGGGISTFGDQVTIANCLFEGNVVTSYAVLGGDGGDFGGGVSGTSFFGETTRITNCVFARNQAGEGAALAALNGHLIEVRNTIIWGNTWTGQDVAPLKGQVSGNLDYRHSCVQTLFEPVPGEDPPDPSNFPGCLDADPRFVALATGDLHLQADSPCIDAGENSVLPVFLTMDLDGLPRRFDDPAVVDTGLGTAPLVDMGPYEHASGTVEVPPRGASAGAASLLVFPNPSSGRFHLSWAIPTTSPGRLEIFDGAGRLAAIRSVPAGAIGAAYEAGGNGAARLPSGSYFIRLRSERFEARGRLSILR